MNLFKTKFFVFAILILIWSCDNQMNEEFPDGPAFAGMTWYKNSAVFLLTLETNSVESQTIGNFYSKCDGEISIIGLETGTKNLNYFHYDPNSDTILVANHPFLPESDSSYILTLNSNLALLTITEGLNTLNYITTNAEIEFDPDSLSLSVGSLILFVTTEDSVIIQGNLSISKTIEIESSSPTTLSWAEETILLPTIDTLRLAFALDHTFVRYLTFDNISTSYPGNWTFDGDNIAVTEIGSNGVQLNPYNVYWNQSTNTMITNFQFDVDELIEDLEYNFGLKTGTLDAALWNVDVTFSDEK